MTFFMASSRTLARWPDDPGEDDCLMVLALDGHRKRRELAFGHIISLAFDEFQCAMLLEDNGSRFGMLLVDFAIGCGNSRNKSIDISHEGPPSFDGRLPQRCRLRGDLGAEIHTGLQFPKFHT